MTGLLGLKVVSRSVGVVSQRDSLSVDREMGEAGANREWLSRFGGDMPVRSDQQWRCGV